MEGISPIDCRANFYALYLCIKKDYSCDKALSVMGVEHIITNSGWDDKKKKIHLSEVENIRHMYLDLNMYASEIAKVYKCSDTAVYYFLQKNRIDRKTRGFKRRKNKCITC